MKTIEKKTDYCLDSNIVVGVCWQVGKKLPN